MYSYSKKTAYFISMLLIFSSSQTYTSEKDKRFTYPAYNAQLGSYPWVVQKVASGWHKCTAVLISEKHALTSAHCLDNDYKYTNLELHFLNAKHPFTLKAIRFIAHPNYQQQWKNDIAIIEIELPVKIEAPNIYLNATCPDMHTDFLNPRAAGYGAGSQLKTSILKWLEPCSSHEYFLQYQGYGEGGDSGGPLFHLSNTSYNLLGIYRGSYKINQTKLYYISLSFNKEFIDDHIGYIDTYNTITGQHQKSAYSLNVDSWVNIPATSATSATSGNLNFIFLTILLNILLHAI